MVAITTLAHHMTYHPGLFLVTYFGGAFLLCWLVQLALRWAHLIYEKHRHHHEWEVCNVEYNTDEQTGARTVRDLHQRCKTCPKVRA